ncbi:glutathione S-transferase family protein [Fulvimonas yonginensis]
MSQAFLHFGARHASGRAMRAWLALREAGFPFQEVAADLRQPHGSPDPLPIGSPHPAVTAPLLVVGETVVCGAPAIMAFANDYARGTLLPKDAGPRAAARSIMAWQHASPTCWRLAFESTFDPWTRPLNGDERSEVARLCRVIEPLLAASTGPFLFGPVSLADLSLAPAAIGLLRHADLSDWPATGTWMEELLSHPPVAAWIGGLDAPTRHHGPTPPGREP